MWNPFRKRTTYLKDQKVWCISEHQGAMPGTVSEVLSDGYIINIPTLFGPTTDYWVLKKHGNERLRSREE